MRLSILVIILLGLSLIFHSAFAAEGTPVGSFVRGSPSGCFLLTPNGWQPLTVPRYEFSVGSRLKTDSTGWGTLIFPFGSFVLRGNSEVRIDPSGLFLQRGSLKAFVQRTAQGFKFRIPGAYLAVRGTVFSFDANGGVNVDTGTIEVNGEQGSPVIINSGQSLNGGTNSSGLPAALLAFEAALRAEHDGKIEQAITAFLDLLTNPAFRGVESFREHLLEKALTNFCRSDLPATHPLVACLQAAARELPNGVFAALEAALALEDISASRRLLAFAEQTSNDSRILIAKALLAEMTLDDASFQQTMKELANSSPQQTLSPRGFWSSSLTFLRAMVDPRLLAPSQITEMISPGSLSKLSPKAAAKRIAVATRLPADILEAQGLYYLIKALKMDGKLKEAEKILAFFKANYPGSLWLDRAIRLMSQKEQQIKKTSKNLNQEKSLKEKAFVDTNKNDFGSSSIPHGNYSSINANLKSTNKNVNNHSSASGKTTGKNEILASETPAVAAGSLDESF